MDITNSSLFNTNSACVGGQVVTNDVSAPGNTIQLVVWTLASAFVIITTIQYYILTKRFTRLKKRSIFAVLLGSIWVVYVLTFRSVYDFQGRQFFRCDLQLVLLYLDVPFCSIPDWMSFMRYLHMSNHRNNRIAGLNWDRRGSLTNAVVSLTGRNANNTPVKESRSVLVSFYRFFKSLYLLGNWSREEELSLPHALTELFKVIAWFLISAPYLLAYVVRIGTAPYLQPANQCTGCNLNLTDFILVIALVIWTLPLMLLFVRHALSPGQLDPLGILTLGFLSLIFVYPFAGLGLLLVFLDPGQLMRQQKVNWFMFEMISIFLGHCLRCPLQSLIAIRATTTKSETLTLLEVLNDDTGSLLFEKHITAELAAENLQFWRMGIKWKTQFDTKPFEYSQQMARLIWRTFCSKNAQLLINVGHDILNEINFSFKGSNVISKTVFDKALVEVFTMMEQGSYQRFVKSKEFIKYKKDMVDFSESSMSLFSYLPGQIKSTRLSEEGPKETVLDNNVTAYVASL